MASIFALIPARAGSKGVPNKNLRSLGGHPLIEWSIAASRATKLIDRVIVSTDSKQYAELAIDLGAEAPFLRPKEISGDKSTDFEFINHALQWFAANGERPDYIVHIRPTTPFRNPLLIDEAIELFVNSAYSTALRSVHPMAESAYKAFEIGGNGCLRRLAAEDTELDMANNPRQQFPVTYVGNGYVDVLSTTFINRASLIHGDRVMPFVTPQTGEVDSEDDFALLEYQISKNPDLVKRIFGR